MTGTDLDLVIAIVVVLALAVGLVGIVVPVLPGLLLICAALLGWAVYDATPGAWLAVVGAVALTAAATVLKYLLPGRWLVASGVPTWEIVLAGIAGIVGFFVVPLLGLPLFFVGAVSRRVAPRRPSAAFPGQHLAGRARRRPVPADRAHGRAPGGRLLGPRSRRRLSRRSADVPGADPADLPRR